MSVTLRRASDVAYARQAAMQTMAAIGASSIKKTKFVTAVSEIARNAVLYGRGGVITFEIVGSGPRRSVVAECMDRGPGIADVALALTEGYSTGSGLGLGLSGAKRLVDRFEIASSALTGTTVTMECFAR
ncbi:ATP-binding protein [Lutibaculum baratangense]|uniref:Anti-sigma B factor RsbT n=1 Tax=Lutibaculum baratangense AMV1 TaxID=631454 RepID=V4RBK0_9HYPH|nr:ATP-binding protein [Lutibaculum baratangense]ESR23526.1 Anti-sigma B factor RsbT [Lutibaculum baratangense AMV1]